MFDRSTSPLQLTEVGEVYIKAAEEIFQIEQRVENYINNLTTLKTGSLSLGASTLFAGYVLPPIVTDFKKKFPDIYGLKGGMYFKFGKYDEKLKIY